MFTSILKRIYTLGKNKKRILKDAPPAEIWVYLRLGGFLSFGSLREGFSYRESEVLYRTDSTLTDFTPPFS